MPDLVAFLSARVAERQATILHAVKNRRSGASGGPLEDRVTLEMRIRALGDGELDVVNQMVNEVEAVRRIMEEHRTTVSDRVPGFPVHGSEYWCRTCHVPSDESGDNWCVTMRLLALPYADHPDYRDKWRP